MGYGTGAIMAVPGAGRARLGVRRGLRPADHPHRAAVRGPRRGRGVHRRGPGDQLGNDEVSLDGLGVAEAKATIIDWLAEQGTRRAGRSTTSCATGCSAASATGASRSRSSTTRTASATRCPDSMLPVELPEVDDYSPTDVRARGPSTEPEPPLGRAEEWVNVELDLGDGRGASTAARPTRCPTGPDPAGTSCATWTPPTTTPSSTRRTSATGWAPAQPVARRAEGVADPGGVDLYVGGVEHAVLHLLYARFWHKVLFDLGHVSSGEPFRKLFNQGYIQALRLPRRPRPARPGRARSSRSRAAAASPATPGRASRSSASTARWASP